MASVPILSTGRDTAVYLDNSQVNRSAEKLNSELIGTEKLKLNKALQDNEKFLEMMAVDPVALMTQRGVEMQSQELTKYNEKWAEEMRKHKGNLPQDKWIEMRKDRIGLESVQGRLAASQQRYLQELKMIESSPNKYNRDAFMQASKNFYETGEYTTGLAPALGRLNEALDKDVRAYFLSKPNEAVQSVTGKSGKVVTTIASGDPKQGSQRVLSLLFNDETGGYLQDAVNEFLTQPEEVQMKYFDSNKDGKVTEDEIVLAQQFGSDIASFTTNPIVKWAMEEKGKRYQTIRPQISNPASSGSGTATQTTIPEARTTPYLISNQTTSSEFYDTYVKKTDGIPFMLTGNALMVTKANLDKGIKGGDEKELPTGSRSFNGDIVGYAKDKDMVVIRPTSGKGAPDTADLILAPRAELDKAITDGVKIKVNGKVMTINEAAGLGGSAAKKAKPY